MDVQQFYRLCLSVCLCVVCSSLVSAQGPITPDKFYARQGTSVELPCVAGSPRDKLSWKVEHEDSSLRSRSTARVDKDDPSLSVKSIRDVQPSDSGNFECSDGRDSSTVELIVFDPSHPQDTAAQITKPDEVKVTWMAPAKNPEAVKGYKIYVREVSGDGQTKDFEVKNVRPDGKEEFMLEDMSPDSTYEIQVAPLYIVGAPDLEGTEEGPKSPTVRIDTPTFDAPPSRVKAQPWTNSTILVTWQPPRNVDPRGIDGYIVYYQGVSKKKPPSGEVVVDSPGPGGQWQAILDGLKLRIRYKIEVAAFTGGERRVVGKKSPTVVMRHDGFKPELSVKAMALGPETVLVTIETVGGGKVDKLRLLYSDRSAIKWDRVKTLNTKEMSAIVTGLQPRTEYFFHAKARIDKKARQVVTHVLTPPTALSAPTDVSVSAITDDSVQVSWAYNGRFPAQGFIVMVDRELEDGTFSPYRQAVALKENEALVDDLRDDHKYQAKVIPFDLDGKGLASEPVLFHISAHNLQTSSPDSRPSLPYFIDEIPERLEINVGEDVKLTCTASGNPVPEVSWFKDGQPVGESIRGVNELFLTRIRESTELQCQATNAAGSVTRSTRVDVTEGLAPEPERARFIHRLPEKLDVEYGGDIRQLCSATGFPVPDVLWYKNGIPVPSANNVPGTAEFWERDVTTPFRLRCEAVNVYGRMEHDIEVAIREQQLPPAFVGQMPDRIVKNYGEPLSIPCAFTGNPTPMVIWYDGRTPVGPAAPYQNTLEIRSVEKTTYYRCLGENDAGRSEQIVALIVRPRGPEYEESTPPPPEYSVSIWKIPISDTDVEVRWAIDEGDLTDIRSFDCIVSTSSGMPIMRQRLSADHRSITLTSLRPQARYYLNLVTWVGDRVADNSTVEIIPAAPDVIPNQPILHIRVVEVRDNTARVDFKLLGFDPRLVPDYNLRVKDLDVGPIGNTIFDRRLPPNAPSITLQSLKPKRRYQTILDVLSRFGSPIVSASAIFYTPAFGEFGNSVSTSSLDTPEPTPPPVTSRPHTPATTSTVSTPPPPPRSTTTRRPRYTTTTTTATTTTEEEGESDHSYVMTAQTSNKTPYRVDIRWTVDRGPLEGVRSFVVTITNDRGQVLLEQELQSNQRSITIQSLNPDTKYFVNVKAKGDDGYLVESDLAVLTPSAGAVQDTSNPVLELEANEIRDTTTRLDWSVVNGEPDLVTNYRLQVLDGSPKGANLLTQTVPANSQSLFLQKLQPRKRYHVIVDALDEKGNKIMKSSLTFETAGPNRYGVPVRASSSETKVAKQPEMPQSLTQTEPPEPVLNMEVKELTPNSVQLTWDLVDAPPDMVSQYQVLAKSDGPGGTVLLNRKMSPLAHFFNIEGLVKNSKYYIELQALAPTGYVVLTAGAPYVPGQTRMPIRASSERQTPTHLRAPQPLRDRPEDIPKPELDMELRPEGSNEVRVNWTLVGEDSREPVRGYRFRVHQNDLSGQSLLDELLPSNVRVYTVSRLQDKIQYYIHLEALDARRQPIQYVASKYLLPPPGYPVEPIATSSVFNPKPTQEAPKQAEPEPSKLFIVEARPQGSDSLHLEWFDTAGRSGAPTKNTMIRYAEFKGNSRERYQIKIVPAGQRSLTITDLKPNTSYGFQVASVATGGQYVRWSDLVIRKTNDA